jgi:penicillin-binding protein 1A
MDSTPDDRREEEPAGEPSKKEAPPPAETPRAPSALVRWLKRLGIAAVMLTALGVLAVALVIRHFEEDLPSTSELKKYHPPQVTRVLARDGTLLGELFVERRTLVSIDAIPTQMKLAVLAAEDAKFYEHAGLNYLGMLRAILVNLRHAGSRQGGSTITQQVVKNVLLTSERTYGRKIREAILARRIEQELTKDEILELYLNHIYFGHGRYGVEEASRYYFGKSIRDVSLPEAALLAGVPKGPAVYSPRIDLAKSTARRAFVLSQMAEKGFASAEQAEAAKREPVVLAPETETLPELAPEVVSEAKRTLRAVVGDAADAGGYTITTTIDPVLEVAARTALRKNLDDYAKRHKLLAPLAKGKHDPTPAEETPKAGSHRIYQAIVTSADDAKGTLGVKVGTLDGTIDLKASARYNPKALPPSQFAETGKVLRVSLLSEARAPGDHEPPPEDEPHAKTEGDDALGMLGRFRLELGPEGALIAVDVRTREILALVGSYEAVAGALDRATNAHRQPGSTFKAFVYGYAIKARALTPASILETNPDALVGYRPENHDPEEGSSPRRLRDALAMSVNVAAVWAIDRVGPANVAAYAHTLGIESKLGADASLALGSYEVTPREMVAAYATYAAGGVYEQPFLVQRIVGPNGVEVALPPRPPSRRAVEEAEAYVTTSLLTSVVESGTGKRAKSLGRPIAGKTGTSNASKDAWFVGYSPDVACAVWTGFDDATTLGAGEAGATAALPTFVDFMREAHRKRPIADFPVPAGVVRVAIDPASGLRAAPDQKDALQEVFLAGTEPTEVAQPDAGVDASSTDASAPTEPAAVDAGVAPPSPPPAPSGSIAPEPEAPPF